VITKFILRRFMFGIAVAFVVAITALLAWANWPGDSIASGAVADRVVVLKAKRELELYANGKLLKSYPVSLGRNPVGPKLQD
jgi:hypothetical protein